MRFTDTNGNTWNVPSDAVRALDVFNPDKPTMYRAVPPWAVDAPLRASRAEAFTDINRVPSSTGVTV